MEIKHHFDDDGSLIFEGVRPGNLVTGEPLSWDQLRELVIKSTRFAVGRKIESRTLQEFTDSVTAFVKERSQSINQDKRDLHNAYAIIQSLEDTIGRQNQQINEMRQQYIEAARASAARQQTA